jgi:hypothetical protein
MPVFCFNACQVEPKNTEKLLLCHRAPAFTLDFATTSLASRPGSHARQNRALQQTLTEVPAGAKPQRLRYAIQSF